jgi:hypothetical protein
MAGRDDSTADTGLNRRDTGTCNLRNNSVRDYDNSEEQGQRRTERTLSQSESSDAYSDMPACCEVLVPTVSNATYSDQRLIRVRRKERN